MVPELEEAMVTEIQVRMDCNGCVQKIKKALAGVNGIYQIYVDFPQQKIKVIGTVDPEKILKAIKKTKKIPTICAYLQPPEPVAQSTEAQEGEAPSLEVSKPPPPESPQTETAQPAELPNNPPPSPENPLPKTTPPPDKDHNKVAQPAQPPIDSQSNQTHPPEKAHNNVAQPAQPPIASKSNQSGQPSESKDVEEIHATYRHPPDHGNRYGYDHANFPGYGRYWRNYYNSQGLVNEPPPPIHVSHSYNACMPSPYVVEYQYMPSPPRQTYYGRMDRYGEDYQNNNNGNGNITSMFSDENPNACTIV